MPVHVSLQSLYLSVTSRYHQNNWCLLAPLSSAMIEMSSSLFLRWMTSCHLVALPCERGVCTIAYLMSRTSMRLDRSSERKSHEALCMYLCCLFLPLPCRIHGLLPVLPTGSYILFMNHFKIELEPFPLQILVWQIKRYQWKEWQKELHVSCVFKNLCQPVVCGFLLMTVHVTHCWRSIIYSV